MRALAGMRRAAGVALAGLALILIALMFDTGPLFVPGVAFAALGIVMPIWLSLAARGARAQRQMPVGRVIEGQPFETTIEVTRGPLGLPGGEIFDPVTGSWVSVRRALSLLTGTRRASVTIVASFARRGRKHLDPPLVVSRDVLGLAEVEFCELAPPDELLVLPRTEPVKWIGRDLGAYSTGAAGRALAEPLAATELDGLRPYRPGSPASRIHWQALARGAGLLERRMRADADTRPLVVLDGRCQGPECEELDIVIRAVGSLVLELARRGGCGLLMPGDRRPIEIDPNLGRWPATHVRLALLQGGPRHGAPLLGRVARLGRVFYVAVEPPRRLPQVLAAPGQLPGVLVVPAGVDPRTRGGVVFEVAGCRGYILAAAARSVPPKEQVA